MQNWWIAAFEHFGLITNEEAKHISENIRLAIHKENYKEAFIELEAILKDGKLERLPLIAKLEADVADLRAELAKIKTPVKVLDRPTVAKTTKA
jgi:hypothetical protein